MKLACLYIMLTAFCHTAAAQEWVDVTDVFITNPDFNGGYSDGWQDECSVGGRNLNWQCMEFWNGTFNIWQDLTGLPKGKYRLSVQAFFRTTHNQTAWQWYNNNEENITAYLYANEQQTPLASVYSYSFPEWANNCWTSYDNHLYPNGMESARNAFDRDAYWNTLEFEADGNATIGLINQEHLDNNWCIFDNFKLEFGGEIVKAQNITIEAEKTGLLVGETLQLTAKITPANTLIKKVTWSSNNTSVATVDENGLVTAVDEGRTNITVRTTDGSNKRALFAVTVSRNQATANSLIINEIMVSNIDEFISPATNFDGWIELYNPTAESVELTGLSLTDHEGNQWTITKEVGVLPANGYRVIWFDSNDIAPQNVPFKLDTDGGKVTISNEKGQVLASQSYPAGMERISYARTTDGGDTWGLTQTPTPGESNNGKTFATQQLAAPVVDQPSQLFTGQLSVNVTIPAGCTLRYTTDGSLPTLEKGLTGNGQFSVSETSNYRFRLYADGMLASPVTTRSYILKDRDYYLPVVSVVSDRRFLYNTTLGVLTKGTNGRPGNGQSDKCNWNMNWERPVNFSYLDANGDMVLNQDVNLEACGGWSRAWTPHSFKLKGSKELGGNKNLPYPFFTQKPYIRNRTLQIRNGGNDNYCRFKDPSLAYIVQTSGVDVDVQGYQPVHEFLNGQYIGVLNVREPNNKHYVYANYGWDEDEIDQWEMSPDSGYVQKCGTPDAYNELVDVLSPDAANSETYQEICQLLDIDEFTYYMAIQFFYAGNDWPRNNVKAFRHRDNGKFRFVLFDVDAAFAYGDDVFNQFLWKEVWTFDELYPRGLGRITDQIRLVTLFKNLLQNADYRRKFIDVYSLVSGSIFEASRAQQICDELYYNVQPAMQLNGGSAQGTYSDIRSKLGSRLSTATRALKNYNTLELSSVNAQHVKLNSDAEGAQLLVNGQQVPTGSFNGDLFAPVKLKAIAPAGYTFKGWLSQSAGSMLKAKGSSWTYYDQGSLDGQNWTAANYNTSSWKQGNAPLGYSNNQSITTRLDYGSNGSNKRPTYYFRTDIKLDNAPASSDAFTLDYYVDDGFIIYVNGTEAGRFNMPSGNVTFNTFASTYADQFPSGTISLPANLFRRGNNVIAVEVHNNAANSTDIIWDASISAVLSTSSASYYSTEAEIDLPTGNNVQLTASFGPLSQSELTANGITPVRINEVSGSNSAFINEYGKKNDWVELYNTTDKAIDVEGMFLTDNVDKPEKYMISKDGKNVNTVIPAHGYLLVWCDKLATTDQALHASFKINGEGGTLMLTAANRSWKDILSYTAHDGNSTVGRYPDGCNDVYAMNVPTIAKSNLLSSYVQKVEQENQGTNHINMIAAANGFRIRYGASQLIVKADEADQALVELFTTDGRLIERQDVNLASGSARVSVAHLAPGFYVARATNADGTRVSCKFMK